MPSTASTSMPSTVSTSMPSCISTQGFLYTILSRVEDESQICFLHPITAHEVKHGVNMDALKFDDLYRKQGAIIMEVID